MLNALYYTTNSQFMASQYIKKCCSLLARKMSFILLFILLGKNKCGAHGYFHPPSSWERLPHPAGAPVVRVGGKLSTPSDIWFIGL